MSQDQLQKFMFDAAPVRGELVALHDSWREILARRSYPEPVLKMLGDMVAAAALLSANLKFDGALVMQLHGDGPVSMLVVECTSELTLRATAKLDPDAAITDAMTLTELVNANGGGRFAITLDPRDKAPGQQPYQGIVPLTDGHAPLTTIAVILEHYLLKSEQLDTRLWLASDAQCAAGLLLQKLPSTGGQVRADLDVDAWERLSALSATITADELLTLPPDTVLRRLFLEESELHGVRVFDPLPVAFACSCSRTRVGDMLKMLGADEVAAVLCERDAVEVDCDFCGQHYRFDPVDCAQLFAHPTTAGGIEPASPASH